ncbi:MAG TPA: hypothetical protein VGB43_04965, partial [Flavobacterium sp.]
MKSKFHSLLLLLFLALFSCKEDSKTINENQSNAQKHLDLAQLETSDSLTRLAHSDSAYGYAKHSNDKSLLWRAFSTKYALAKQRNTHGAAAMLRSYLSDSKKLNDTLNIANAYYETAKYYNEIGKKDSAFQYFNASKIKYELLKDSLQVAEKLLWQADIYAEYNDYIEMESASTEALKYLGRSFETSIDTAYATAAFTNYGRAYTQLSNIPDALVYLDKASNLTRDPISLDIIQNNKAVAFMEIEDYTSAIAILQKLEASPSVKSNPETRSKVLGNLGFCYFKTNDVRSLDHLKKSIEIREQTKDSFGQIPGYIHLSDYYAKTDQLVAQKYAKKAYSIASSIKSADDRLEALKRLRETSTGSERDHYSTIYISTQDSISDVRQKAKNQFAKVRYDAGEATAENSKLRTRQIENKLEIEKRKRANDFLYFSLILGLVISTLLYFLL